MIRLTNKTKILFGDGKCSICIYDIVRKLGSPFQCRSRLSLRFFSVKIEQTRGSYEGATRWQRHLFSSDYLGNKLKE
jgi:hypothetical protein